MDFQAVVAGRRMVRHFAPDPIERAVLERIARTAQRAPSAGFSQGQRLVVVTDPDIRRRVAANCSEAYYIAEGFDPWISEAPALFVPCVSEAIYRARYREPDKVAAEATYQELYGESDGAEDDEWPVPYWWMDIGCTVMLVLLAAVDEGLAAGFVSSGDLDGLRAELSIPPDFTPVGVIPVGRQLPDKRSGSVKRRFVEPEEFVRWERWTQM
jgi:FMN reductase [NAD(P)H]